MYFTSRIEERYQGKRAGLVTGILTWPLREIVKMRMRKRWFKAAWEWELFARLARRTFGYL
jgi:hypothetical protein